MVTYRCKKCGAFVQFDNNQIVVRCKECNSLQTLAMFSGDADETAVYNEILLKEAGEKEVKEVAPVEKDTTVIASDAESEKSEESEQTPETDLSVSDEQPAPVVAEPEPSPSAADVPASPAASVNVDSLVERVFIFLEDEQWAKADEYCERILDIEPKNAFAYLGKLMSELKVPEKSMLAACAFSFADNGNYKKIIRYGDAALCEEINGYLEKVQQGVVTNSVAKETPDAEPAVRNEPSVQQEISAPEQESEVGTQDGSDFADDNETVEDESYDYGESNDNELANSETADNNFAETNLASNLSGFEGDSAELTQSSLNEYNQYISDLEKQQKSFISPKLTTDDSSVIESIYISSKALFEQKRFVQAAMGFNKVSGYKDSAELAFLCKKQATDEKIQVKYRRASDILASAKSENDFLNAAQIFKSIMFFMDSARLYQFCLTKASEAKIKEAKSRRASNIVVAVISCLAVLISIAAILIPFVIYPNYKYNQAVEAYDNEYYEEAYQMFVDLGDYKESEDFARLCNYELFDEQLTSDLKRERAEVAFGQYDNTEYMTDQTWINYNNLEWIVLDIVDDKALLVYNDYYYNLPLEEYDGYWYDSDIREYLNDEFLDQHFNRRQQNRIIETEIYTNGNSTVDKVFLLSQEEYDYYKCTLASYDDYYFSSNSYWLRDINDGYKMFVSDDEVYYDDYSYSNEYNVRPAMWIYLE